MSHGPSCSWLVLGGSKIPNNPIPGDCSYLSKFPKAWKTPKTLAVPRDFMGHWLLIFLISPREMRPRGAAIHIDTRLTTLVFQ